MLLQSKLHINVHHKSQKVTEESSFKWALRLSSISSHPTRKSNLPRQINKDINGKSGKDKLTKKRPGKLVNLMSCCGISWGTWCNVYTLILNVFSVLILALNLNEVFRRTRSMCWCGTGLYHYFGKNCFRKNMTVRYNLDEFPIYGLYTLHGNGNRTGTKTKRKIYYNVEIFTLVLDRNRNQDPLFPIVPVLFPLPSLVPCSVHKPSDR